MNDLQPIELEYVYITIPAEYICVYHRILAMLADYGEDMLKDCKASCTDKNSGVIECFNMFNAAVAAHKLGKTSEADTIIKYVKAKINQIYNNHDNSTSFVFPVDENGQLKAFVSCGERPKFKIRPEDMNLYEHKFGNGFDEHFQLGPEDEAINIVTSKLSTTSSPVEKRNLNVKLTPRWETINDTVRPCADIIVKYNGKKVDVKNTTYQYYFDDNEVIRFNDIANPSKGVHNFKIVVTYNNETKIASVDAVYPPSASNKKKKSNMPRFIHRKAIRPSSQEKEIYYTDTITLQSSNTDVYNVDALSFPYYIARTIVWQGKDIIAVTNEIHDEQFDCDYFVKTGKNIQIKENIPAGLSITFKLNARLYITRKGNMFIIQQSLNDAIEHTLPIPSYNEIQGACIGLHNRTLFEIQRRVTRSSRKSPFGDWPKAKHKVWRTITNNSKKVNCGVFRIRRRSLNGYRSDWVYCTASDISPYVLPI